MTHFSCLVKIYSYVLKGIHELKRAIIINNDKNNVININYLIIAKFQTYTRYKICVCRLNFSYLF